MNKLYYIKHVGNFISGLLYIALRIHSTIFRGLRKNKTLPPKKILLIKMWGVGNITILLPILKNIKEQFKDTKIYFITLDSNKGLLENSPYVTKVLYFRFITNIFKIAADFIKHLVIFNKLKIDLLLNFEQCNRLSVIFSYMTGAKTQIGFDMAKCNYGRLYTKTTKNDPNLHVSQNFINLARKVGVDIDKYRYISPDVDSNSKENVKKSLRQFGLENKIIVVLHIGSGENFKGKRWKDTNFARLADKLIEKHNLNIVYTGVQKERKLIENTILKMKHKALNLCGQFTLPELVEFLRCCYLFISNDTGPLHIAISLGINTVGLYGPMSPRQYGSLNHNSLSFYKPVGCNPCLTDLNYKTSLCKKSRCLEQITVQEVLEKISEKFFNQNK